MHRFFGLQACGTSPKVAVLDTIHGANIISQKIADLGFYSQAIEVYHRSESVAMFDLIVAPVHLWPGNYALFEAKALHKTIISHHEAVGKLVKPSCKVFEITGTHSKTSTAMLLAKMLSSRYKIVSHTTIGLQYWSQGKETVLEKGLSTTPGNVIRAAEAAEEKDAQALICEISLGGVGLADYGILTSFSGDYRIAKDTKWATTAKLQMISLAKEGACIIANTDAKVSPDMSFGDNGSVRVEPDKVFLEGLEIPLELDEKLYFYGYQTAISGSIAAAYAAGIDSTEIVEALQGFDGIEGRMKVVKIGNREIFDYSNSGLKASDVERALDKMSGNKFALVVGEEAESVCEGLNIPALLELLKRRRDEIEFLVIVGKRLMPWGIELRAVLAHNLTTGIEIARIQPNISKILLCVKCFR
jgi:UDP-N-acetylmuramyl pentapeptide synthase